MHGFTWVATVMAPTALIAPVQDLTPHIQEAARQTGVPEPVIRAVISAESGGHLRIVSGKGAMGLMQLMPGTWAYLRDKLKLGNDPFDPHDNIFAGTVYLRSLYDAYGWDGFLAAYNAGPGRYESHRDTGQSLPAETRNYVTRITANLDRSQLVFGPNRSVPTPTPWTTAVLFATTDTPPEAGTSPVVSPFQSAVSPFVTLPISDTSPSSE